MFSAGDEVQGLFDGPAAAAPAIACSQCCSDHASSSGGMGIGGWSVHDVARSTMRDGSAYHDARDAVEFAQKSPAVTWFSGRLAVANPRHTVAPTTRSASGRCAPPRKRTRRWRLSWLALSLVRG